MGEEEGKGLVESASNELLLIVPIFSTICGHQLRARWQGKGGKPKAVDKQTGLVGFYLQLTQLATWRSSVQDLPHFPSARSIEDLHCGQGLQGNWLLPRHFLLRTVAYAMPLTETSPGMVCAFKKRPLHRSRRALYLSYFSCALSPVPPISHGMRA